MRRSAVCSVAGVFRLATEMFGMLWISINATGARVRFVWLTEAV